ncbi:M23 family metallopeptidase [Nigerium massiliense]|uniref:M23 family metallopeptidase n=1 Tax=Nigerium massiliense TaxID=1522317 RepID=UPI000693A5A5|nr:M23 family metallopeptidase [Nigerium massiliense]
MSFKKALPVAVLAAGLALPAVAAAPAEAATATTVTRQVCKATSVNVRSGPSTRYKKVGSVKKGVVVRGTKSGGWLKIGTSRWMSYSYTCAPTAPRLVAPAESARATPAPAPATPAPVDPGPAKPATPVTVGFLQPTGTNGSPTSPFGMRVHPITKVRQLHNGIDIGNAAGRPVYAAYGGTVLSSGWSNGGGNTVKIDHGRVGAVATVRTYYLHLSRSVVTSGTEVTRGQLIGYVGSTGSVTVAHLHFCVLENGAYVNPEKYLGPIATLKR